MFLAFLFFDLATWALLREATLYSTFYRLGFEIGEIIRCACVRKFSVGSPPSLLIRLQSSQGRKVSTPALALALLYCGMERDRYWLSLAGADALPNVGYLKPPPTREIATMGVTPPFKRPSVSARQTPRSNDESYRKVGRSPVWDLATHPRKSRCRGSRARGDCYSLPRDDQRFVPSKRSFCSPNTNLKNYRQNRHFKLTVVGSPDVGRSENYRQNYRQKICYPTFTFGRAEALYRKINHLQNRSSN